MSPVPPYVNRAWCDTGKEHVLVDGIVFLLDKFHALRQASKTSHLRVSLIFDAIAQLLRTQTGTKLRGRTGILCGGPSAVFPIFE